METVALVDPIRNLATLALATDEDEDLGEGAKSALLTILTRHAEILTKQRKHLQPTKTD